MAELCKKNYCKRPKKEVLEKLYYKDMFLQREIAEKYEVNEKTIRRWFKRYNIKVRSHSYYMLKEKNPNYGKSTWNKGIPRSKKIKQILRLKTIKAIERGCYDIKPNKPEKIMIELIKQNNLPFNYVGDGQVVIGGFCPDFLSKNPKKIIELFGDYWHNRRGAKERDRSRLRTYSKYGYETLIIWEHELKNPSQVLNKIREFKNA